jgi:outer membrane immunogenic protein
MTALRNQISTNTSLVMNYGLNFTKSIRIIINRIYGGSTIKAKLYCFMGFTWLLPATALAADIGSLTATPPPLLWTGFFVGINAGGTFGGITGLRSQAMDIFDDQTPGAAGAAGAAFANTTAGNTNALGFLGGGQVGFNYQPSSSIVIGAEADIQGVAGSSVNTKFAGTIPDPLASATIMSTAGQIRASIDYFGTIRGRAGYLLLPTFLLYGTAGLAYANTYLNAAYSTSDIAGVYGYGSSNPTYSETRSGWTAGGGAEWMFLPNWSAKVEYLYYDLGSVSLNGFVTGSNTYTGSMGYAYATVTSARYNGNIVRGGLNYHFDWSAPAPISVKH